jgi:hypothetical protein
VPVARTQGTEGGGLRQHGRGRDHPTADLVANAEPSGAVADEDQGKHKRKRKDKEKLECSICTEDHFTNQCPLLKGPKPTVAFCGAAEDGMGFFQIQAARSNQIVNPNQASFTALITVETGEVTAQLIHSELARIIPVRWNWEVQELGTKSFIVPFPSKKNRKG